MVTSGDTQQSSSVKRPGEAGDFNLIHSILGPE